MRLFGPFAGWPTKFDTALLLGSIVCGSIVGAGIAVLYRGAAVITLPFLALLFGLTSAAIARRSPRLVAFGTVTALNLPWMTAGFYQCVVEDHVQFRGLLELAAFAWVAPFALIFVILRATRI